MALRNGRAPALLAILALVVGCQAGTGSPPAGRAAAVAAGPFLGQEPPAGRPGLFAPDLISPGMRTRDIAISPDGREIFFVAMVGGSAVSTILHLRQVEGRWIGPEVLPLAADPRWHYLEPSLSGDGRRLFFVSDRLDTAGGKLAGDEDIWVASRRGDGWGEPTNLGPPVNTPAPEFFPSLTRAGALYFTRRDTVTGREAIWRAQPDGGGGFTGVEELPATVNCGTTRFNAFVSPDERYLIVCVAGRPDNLGQVDYWICFRATDGTWQGPVNLGERFNGPGREGWSPYVSPDGRAFFFMSRQRQPAPAELGALTWSRLQELHRSAGNGLGQIWWIRADFLDSLAAQME
jgi:hypothetical protein